MMGTTPNRKISYEHAPGAAAAMTLCARTNAARLWTLLGSLACLTALLHWANLLYLAHYFACSLPRLTCPGLTSPWITPDTGSYRFVEGDIAHRGFLHASYLYRTPGFPLMLGAARLAFGDETFLLWFVPVLGAVGAWPQRGWRSRSPAESKLRWSPGCCSSRGQTRMR